MRTFPWHFYVVYNFRLQGSPFCCRIAAKDDPLHGVVVPEGASCRATTDAKICISLGGDVARHRLLLPDIEGGRRQAQASIRE